MLVSHISGLVWLVATRLHASDLTFGRNVAEYRQLVEWLALASVALWVAVLTTIALRLAICHIWFRYRYPGPRNNTPK